MAGKEVTVYIVDVGSTMGEKNCGRNQSNLDWALEYVWDRITTTVATGRKTAMDEDEFQNISVVMQIDQALMSDVRRLRNDLVVSNTATGDAISALIIAIQMIIEKCKQLQYLRRIVLVTDARATMHSEDLSEITKKISQDKMELTILGVDFDDPEYGFKEEDKDHVKAENEEILKTLCHDCNGQFGTLSQAIDEIEMPRVKSTRPVHSYKGFLTLGSPEEYDTALSIDVERYPKIMTAKPPTASKHILRSSGTDADQSTAQQSHGHVMPEADDGEGLSSVKYARTYQVNDGDAPGGKRDVPYEALSKGYEYGRTAIYISESDRNVTQFESRQGLDILGFIDSRQHRRYLDMDRAYLIVSQKTNDKASMALSSLIHALYELDSYAVARLVTKDMKEPEIVLLAPNIEPDFECLYEFALPFVEDVRSYKFPPLDRVLTVSGKRMDVHRNLPSESLLQAMGDYVDSMDLLTISRDDDGASVEYAPPDETFSPLLHRINQVIKHRAIFPEAAPPEMYEILTRYSQPPEDLVQKSQSALDRVIKAADVKKVPPKARGKRWGRADTSKPLSDLDVAALLASDTRRKGKRIDAKNAVPEFKQLVENADHLEVLHDACKQLKFIIFDWIAHSVGNSRYQQAVEAIRVMRESMIEHEEPAPFNEFLRDLKKKIFAGEFGGERREMWHCVRVNRLRPILYAENGAAAMTEDEAKQFMIPP